MKRDICEIRAKLWVADLAELIELINRTHGLLVISVSCIGTPNKKAEFHDYAIDVENLENTGESAYDKSYRALMADVMFSEYLTQDTQDSVFVRLSYPEDACSNCDCSDRCDSILKFDDSVEYAEEDTTPVVKFRLTTGAHAPVKAHADDAGYDIKTNRQSDYSILPGETIAFETGVFLDIPSGYEVQVRSRSGMSLKGLVVANSPGTIDSGYKGEVKVIVHNNGTQPQIIPPGTKIAQLVISKLPDIKMVEEGTNEETKETHQAPRGSSGFGSTGV